MTYPIFQRGPGNYAKFFVAATLYISGIILFSSWSYTRQRSYFQSQFDQLLSVTVHASREFIGTGRARQHIMSGTTNAPVYLQHQERFDRFAKECGLCALDVAMISPTGTFYIISTRHGTDAKAIHYGDAADEQTASILQHLAQSRTNAMPSLRFEHLDSGHKRMAALLVADESGVDFAFVAIRETSMLNSLLRNLLLKKVLEGLFLLVMAFPLILLYGETQKKTQMKLTALNTQLQQEIQALAAHEKQLQDAIADLERFNAVSVGRETRIIGLKKEINELLEQTNMEQRYSIDTLD